MKLSFDYEEILKRAICAFGYSSDENDLIAFVSPDYLQSTCKTNDTGDEIWTIVGEITIIKGDRFDNFLCYEIVRDEHYENVQCTLRETDSLGEILSDGRVIKVQIPDIK